jgi:hypothetical protein
MPVRGSPALSGWTGRVRHGKSDALTGGDIALLQISRFACVLQPDACRFQLHAGPHDTRMLLAVDCGSLREFAVRGGPEKGLIVSSPGGRQKPVSRHPPRADCHLSSDEQ